jgi:hypothetical protein
MTGITIVKPQINILIGIIKSTGATGTNKPKSARLKVEDLEK